MENRINELEKKVLVIETKVENNEQDTKNLIQIMKELRNEIKKQNRLVYWVQGAIIMFLINQMGLVEFAKTFLKL